MTEKFEPVKAHKNRMEKLENEIAREFVQLLIDKKIPPSLFNGILHRTGSEIARLKQKSLDKHGIELDVIPDQK